MVGGGISHGEGSEKIYGSEEKISGVLGSRFERKVWRGCDLRGM